MARLSLAQRHAVAAPHRRCRTHGCPNTDIAAVLQRRREARGYGELRSPGAVPRREPEGRLRDEPSARGAGRPLRADRRADCRDG